MPIAGHVWLGDERRRQSFPGVEEEGWDKRGSILLDMLIRGKL
jgi:hypothetical protein